MFVQADKITNMIGYPEYIMNNTALEEKYSDLFAEENSYFANSVRFNKVLWIDLSLLLYFSPSTSLCYISLDYLTRPKKSSWATN